MLIYSSSPCQVGASVLSRALAKLPKGAVSDDIIIGLGARDDAAVVRPPPPGHVLVQTVDFFRSFVSDPYEFGAIAANNALGVSDERNLKIVNPTSAQESSQICRRPVQIRGHHSQQCSWGER